MLNGMPCGLVWDLIFFSLTFIAGLLHAYAIRASLAQKHRPGYFRASSGFRGRKTNGRSNSRTKSALWRARRRGQGLLLVRLRAQRLAAVLRRLAQSRRPPPDGLQGGEDRGSLALRLQGLEQQALLRRLAPQAALARLL